MANTIQAIINLINDPQLELGDYYNSRHRANSEGKSLEEYIKDLYAGTLRESDEQKRLEMISKVFSYLGNDSNPPDAIIKDGDAIEIKKIESLQGEIQLNSSHPKCELSYDNPMITEACKKSEKGKWKKDLLYIVGSVNKKTLRSMFMVYGVDYAASEKVYLNVKNKIKEGLTDIPGVELIESKEIGRINNVDPLGITKLRIRGMWILQNPWKAFSYVTKQDKTKKFDFCAIINEKKYKSFPEYKVLEELAKKKDSLEIKNIKIKNPNNPAKLVKAKMIRFSL